MARLGLIGYSLEHSFSKGYFEEKFRKEGIEGIKYDNFPLSDIGKFPELIYQNPDLVGLNVTIPYKREVITYLDELSPLAEEIRAVNTITIKREGHKVWLKGHNTDITGFMESIEGQTEAIKKALILGSGGASQAIMKALEKLQMDYLLISRKRGNKALTYDDVDETLIKEYPLIINCTPLGMQGREDEKPPLPYEHLGKRNFLYDLIYNPSETLFLKEGKKRGAQTQNGRKMLIGQAEHAWLEWRPLLPISF